MQWHEVFGKYFNVYNRELTPTTEVIVFVPGTLTDTTIRYCYATVQQVEEGLDFSKQYSFTIWLANYGGDVVGKPFELWEEIVQITQQDRVCRKIRVMEERWKKFQESKRSINISRLRDTTSSYILYDNLI